ncbi:RagB/SusD family nutrient uptake outer membrane protein [Pedobacter endophyticus]|uniref:RagB/SusD family nutrient uptake outer membrane protein n=1 Tax=Pedobacter endophyticus TaxID=2789740 RepID=A0A7S9L2S8_9SPHI|nr:RagB/SusD family nutrient uptake outer membrane protein [Pedobacter endophyticus]QPH41431.1 RagB/SusD family nutrient uptake outer membrane protein [Pedobacter endophyticus]
MKKEIIFACALAVMLTMYSCKKDFLERKPRDLISEIDAYGSQTGLEAVTVRLYSDMLIEDLNYEVAETAGYLSTITDEAVRSYTWAASVINGPVIGNWFGSWDYGKIRRINEFIAKVDQSPVSDDLKKRFKAEGRFIRAFHYFAMVKRYGGVPLITEAQQFVAGADEATLQVQRSKEQDIYDFIAKELDEIKADLPSVTTGTDINRINKYVALALKSRAMLYAGCSAKYATVQKDGLVGIPSTMADAYFKASFDASAEIINDNKYTLYDTGGDKSANFQNLFLTPNNSEAIFSKLYKSPEVTHSFDWYNAPQSFRIDWGCATNPTLDMVEEFEYIDGSPGKLKIKDVGGQPIVYNNPQDLFLNKDPRLSASIMLPFSAWQGGVLEIRRGVIDGGVKYTSEDLNQGYPNNGDGFKRVGKDGPLTTWDPTKTGFYIKKFMNPNARVPYAQSTTPFMVFRLGEILLNHAEAALELSSPKTSDALTSINKIRNRAGIIALTTVDIDKVRHERKVELAFENHRFWDLRRWRIASTVLVR